MDLIATATAWNKKKYLTCLHEAGHAEICLHLSIPFQFVEILSHDIGRLGTLPKDLEKILYAKILLGGVVAESIHTGVSLSTFQCSMDDAIELRRLKIDDTFLRPNVEDVLRMNWERVEAIAQLLMEKGKITYRQTQNL